MKYLQKLDLKLILIILLIGAVLLQRCGGDNKEKGETIKVDGKKYEVIKRVVDTVEVEKVQIEYKEGKTIYKDKPIYVPIPTNISIDTLQILKDYYSKNTYKDTIKLDNGLGSISIIDTISQNKIQYRTFKSNIFERQITDITIVKELPRFQVYFGILGGINDVDILNNVGLGLILKTKKDKIYLLDAGITNTGINNTITPYIGGGIFWKIKLQK